MAQPRTKKRIDALDTEIAGIETESTNLTAQHCEHVAAGQDGKADQTFDEIAAARKRVEAAQMRRAPLMRV